MPMRSANCSCVISKPRISRTAYGIGRQPQLDASLVESHAVDSFGSAGVRYFVSESKTLCHKSPPELSVNHSCEMSPKSFDLVILHAISSTGGGFLRARH